MDDPSGFNGSRIHIKRIFRVTKVIDQFILLELIGFATEGIEVSCIYHSNATVITSNLKAREYI